MNKRQQMNLHPKHTADPAGTAVCPIPTLSLRISSLSMYWKRAGIRP